LTDRPIALPVLRQNVDRNAVPQVQVVELTWGDEENLEPIGRPYDIVIGADIVYIEDTFADLLGTVDRVSDDNTTVVLSCRLRYERDRAFLEMFRKRFRVRLLHESGDVKVFGARKL